MKNRFESAEVFEMFAELDVIHLALEGERDAMLTARPAAAIDQMIDEATGFGVARDLESIDRICSLVERQVWLEGQLDIDTSNGIAFLNEMTALERDLKEAIAA